MAKQALDQPDPYFINKYFCIPQGIYTDTVVKFWLNKVSPLNRNLGNGAKKMSKKSFRGAAGGFTGKKREGAGRWSLLQYPYCIATCKAIWVVMLPKSKNQHSSLLKVKFICAQCDLCAAFLAFPGPCIIFFYFSNRTRAYCRKFFPLINLWLDLCHSPSLPFLSACTFAEMKLLSVWRLFGEIRYYTYSRWKLMPI